MFCVVYFLQFAGHYTGSQHVFPRVRSGKGAVYTVCFIDKQHKYTHKTRKIQRQNTHRLPDSHFWALSGKRRPETDNLSQLFYPVSIVYILFSLYQIYIQKRAGCYNIKCPICGVKFCYKCGERLPHDMSLHRNRNLTEHRPCIRCHGCGLCCSKLCSGIRDCEYLF